MLTRFTFEQLDGPSENTVETYTEMLEATLQNYLGIIFFILGRLDNEVLNDNVWAKGLDSLLGEKLGPMFEEGVEEGILTEMMEKNISKIEKLIKGIYKEQAKNEQKVKKIFCIAK